MSDRIETTELESVWEDSGHGLEVHQGEFVLVTADGSDRWRYEPIAALLQRIRKVFGVDAVFVSQFLDGEPLVRCATPLDDGGEQPCDPLEATFGLRELAARPRLPRPRTAPRQEINPEFLAVPVTSRDGSEYGTLCALVFSVCNGGHTSHEAMQSVASLLAATLDGIDTNVSRYMPLHELAPAAQWAPALAA